MSLRAIAAGSTCPSAATHVNDGHVITEHLFAIADGTDAGTGSGHAALREVVRCLGLRPYPHVGLLRDAFRRAHFALWFRDEGTNMLRSTVTVVVWLGTQIAIGHVGDTRAYLLRGTSVQQLTTDHAGEVGNDKLVSRLGDHQRPPDPEIRRLRVGDGDRLVLCTDGLWRTLASSSLPRLSSLTPADACSALCARVPPPNEEASVVVVDFAEAE